MEAMVTNNITVLIPKHCSILKYFSAETYHIIDESFRGTNCQVKGSEIGSNTNVLGIQVRREGIVWKELKQLFINNDDNITLKEKAILALGKGLEKFIFDTEKTSPLWKQIITQLYQNRNEPYEELAKMAGNADQKNDSSTIDTTNENSMANPEFYSSSFFSCQMESILSNNRRLSDDAPCIDYKRNKKENNNTKLFLFIFPPYPTPSRYESSSDLHPEKLFTSSLIKLENLQIRLQTLNAYIATLGGGYFLCRYLSTAVRLARYQRQVALALGDINLAAKCTVNEAYNYIYYGEVDYALRLIQKVKAEAKQRDDSLTVSMCKSAILFAKRLEKAQKYEDEVIINEQKNTHDHINNSSKMKERLGQTLSSSASPWNQISSEKHKNSHSRNDTKCQIMPSFISETVDDFQRIRIVRDKSEIISY